VTDRSSVDDVLQKVFLRVFRALPTFSAGGTPFRAWLFTVCRTTLIDHQRMTRRVEPAAPLVVAERRELARHLDEGLGWGASAEIHAHVDELPLAQRQVLVLLYRFGLTAVDAASVLGRTPDSVRQLRHRALAALQAQLSSN
jgi:RNA polymerase sigma-70 factor (ECF subfamily)